MENTNLFTIRVQDASPETAYRVMKSVITNYPEVAEYIIGATTLTVVDESGVPAVPVNSQDALRAGTYGAAAGLAAAFLLLFLYVRTRKTIHWADDIKKLTNAAFLGNLPQAKIKKRSSVKEQTITICNPKVPDAFKEAVQLIDGRAKTECSGNVTKENIAKIRDVGVDYVSSGALTHSAPILDISLKNLHPLS